MLLESLNNYQGIYKITNKLSNEIYVGKSTNFWLRLGQHIKKSSSPRLGADFKRLGLTNFSWEVLQYVEDERDLTSLEKYWINFYKAEGYILYNKEATKTNPLKTDSIIFKELLKEYKLKAIVDGLGEIAIINFKTGFDLCYYLGLDTESFIFNYKANNLKLWNTDLKLTNYPFEYFVIEA